MEFTSSTIWSKKSSCTNSTARPEIYLPRLSMETKNIAVYIKYCILTKNVYNSCMEKTWIYEYRYTPSWRKLKYEKVICICWKEYFSRADYKSKSWSCWCVQIENIKRNITLWKSYNDLIPLEEIWKWVSTSWNTKRRQFICLCKLCNSKTTIIS